MSCLEHIIENTLCRFKEGKNYDEIIAAINADINKPYVRLTVDEIYEVCQYVHCCWCDSTKD